MVERRDEQGYLLDSIGRRKSRQPDPIPVRLPSWIVAARAETVAALERNASERDRLSRILEILNELPEQGAMSQEGEPVDTAR